MVYKPFSSFCFRFPLLSYNHLEDSVHYDFFTDYLNQEKWQEAIYLGSPVLYQELSKLSKDFDSEQKQNRQILYSLNRYINRMTTRCTPFGLFAGCGIGKTGEHTAILLNDKMDRTSRLDMFYLCALYDALLKIPEIKQHITYYPNTTLYSSGEKYRYVEWKYFGTRRRYELTEVDRSIYLNKMLKKAVNGARSDELINTLISPQISHEVAEEFINELIDSQLLIGELCQAITGEDFFIRLLKLIEPHESKIQISNPLKTIKSSLEELDKGNSGIEVYEKIISFVKEIEVPYEENICFKLI